MRAKRSKRFRVEIDSSHVYINDTEAFQPAGGPDMVASFDKEWYGVVAAARLACSLLNKRYEILKQTDNTTGRNTPEETKIEEWRDMEERFIK